MGIEEKRSCEYFVLAPQYLRCFAYFTHGSHSPKTRPQILARTPLGLKLDFLPTKIETMTAALSSVAHES
jgi:hypothetical protein